MQLANKSLYFFSLAVLALAMSSEQTLGAATQNGPNCQTSSQTWRSTPFARVYTGEFLANFIAKPLYADMNSVIGLSDVEANHYTDLAVIVRFNPSGTIDARNGSMYAAETAVPYQPNRNYSFQVRVNIPASTFSAWVQEEGSSQPTLVADHYAFRTEKSGVKKLNRLAMFSEVGSNDVCAFRARSIGNQPPLANAGPDQEVQDADQNGSEQVTLNGGASFDPEGSALSYVWLEGTQQIATGQAPNVHLANGIHTITLEVTDARHATAIDTVRITVSDSHGGGSGEKPGPHNTGPYDENSLTQYNGPSTITVDGTTIVNKIFSGQLTISANNVTLRNFRLRANGNNYGILMTAGKHGILLEDGEVLDADSALLYGGGFTARRLELHESGADAIKATNDTVVEASWMHHLGTNAEAHADGVQIRRGSNYIFRGNNFDIPASVPPPYKSNANLIIQTAEGPIDNVLIEGNWLNGGNATIYLTDKGNGYGTPTNVRVLNNCFGRDYRYFLIYMHGTALICGNTWCDSGELIDENNSTDCP